MINTVLTKKYFLTGFDRNEILRYAGVSRTYPEIDELLSTCISEIENKLEYKVCYIELPVEIIGDVIDFSFAKTKSKDLAKNLNGCKSAIVFGATIGIEIDRLINKYSSISPSKSLMFQAVGTERIESLCDAFEAEVSNDMKTEEKFIRPRFSAGYGDLSLEFQKDIFRILDCSRKIGASLNDSLIMSPIKSVTAVIGISDTVVDCKTDCDICNKTDCTYRRTK